ncbi:MAG: hypothetical protein GF320_04270 [Armatimonadia bacterium]|nr:hypothetical protein [Armatimonadia bacterium]
MYSVKLDSALFAPPRSRLDSPDLAYAAKLAEVLDHEECRRDPELRKWAAACVLAAAPFPTCLTIGGDAQ